MCDIDECLKEPAEALRGPNHEGFNGVLPLIDINMSAVPRLNAQLSLSNKGQLTVSLSC